MSRPCAACGADVALSARHCPECGAPNPGRRNIAAIVTVLAVLGPAIAIAVYAATRWDNPIVGASDRPTEQSLPAQTIAARDDNYDWLALAMKACDEKATAEPNALHFLVIPIAYDAATVERWRPSALNRIGNALVLPGHQTLEALRKKSLSIATEPFTFSIRDDQTGAIRRWDTATGVKWLSIADADSVSAFKMQYRPRGRGQDDVWGNGIQHRKGNCYWVNALYED